jgi:hypothetical protein
MSTQTVEDPAAETRITAFHEAGHVVAYWLVRQPLEIVTVVPSSRATVHGAKTHGFVRRMQGPMTPWDESFTSVAGPIAQALLSSKEPAELEDWEETLTWEDHLMGTYLNGAAEDLRCDKFFMDFDSDPALMEAARDRIDRHWNGVVVVAYALIKHGTLTGTEAYELLDRMKF